MNPVIETVFSCFLDSLIDSLKLLPFLFLTYIAMEYMEHKAGDKMENIIKKESKFGPFIGSIFGAFPQCGFSAAASNFYAGRIITMGTLISIYLSTSDEMLPIMISEKVGLAVIGKFLLIKIIIGMISGFLIDLIFSSNLTKESGIETLCEKHHCHCENNGVIKSAFKHTAEIFAYILGITFALSLIISFIGESAIASFITNKPFIGEILSAIIGLIPNCAGSVIITQLYLRNVISFGATLAGLLSGSGVGILVLFRVNDDKKENLKVLGLTYVLAVLFGFVFGLFIK